MNGKRECLKLISNAFAVIYSAIKKENETFNQFSYGNILRSGRVNCTFKDGSRRIFYRLFAGVFEKSISSKATVFGEYYLLCF